MANPVDEVVFALASERNELLDMFLHAATEFSRKHAELAASHHQAIRPE
jgi:hypothetical protein